MSFLTFIVLYELIVRVHDTETHDHELINRGSQLENRGPDLIIRDYDQVTLVTNK